MVDESPFDGFEDYQHPNWDGYGACCITPDTLLAAQRFCDSLPVRVSRPWVAPAPDGTIGLEWLILPGFRKVFVDIGPGAILSVYARRLDGEKMFAGPVGSDNRGLWWRVIFGFAH